MTRPDFNPIIAQIASLRLKLLDFPLEYTSEQIENEVQKIKALIAETHWPPPIETFVCDQSTYLFTAALSEITNPPNCNRWVQEVYTFFHSMSENWEQFEIVSAQYRHDSYIRTP